MKYLLMIWSNPQTWGHPIFLRTPEAAAMTGDERAAMLRDFEELMAEISESGELVTAQALADPLDGAERAGPGRREPRHRRAVRRVQGADGRLLRRRLRDAASAPRRSPGASPTRRFARRRGAARSWAARPRTSESRWADRRDRRPVAQRDAAGHRSARAALPATSTVPRRPRRRRCSRQPPSGPSEGVPDDPEGVAHPRSARGGLIDGLRSDEARVRREVADAARRPADDARRSAAGCRGRARPRRHPDAAPPLLPPGARPGRRGSP